jgi:hypothetical protein
MAFTYEAASVNGFIDIAVDKKNTMFISGSFLNEYFSYMGIHVSKIDADFLHRLSTIIIGDIRENYLSYCAGTKFIKTDKVENSLIDTLIEESNIIFEYSSSDYIILVDKYPLIINAINKI